jgi:hypothetical protein
MSFPLPGYVISRALRTSAALRTYEVAREGDGQLFVARVRELDDAMLRLRVVQQLERLRNLALPGIARISAIEQVGKIVVVLGERAHGMSLHERSRGHPVAVGEVLAIATQLCAVVEQLHAQVVMHGDLRPATILVEPQTRTVTLADPGIARVLGVGITLAHELDYVDALLPYLAPEQLGRTPSEPDARSDLHAIGVTLYELLTGRRPFSANTASELTRAQLVRRPRPPHELRPAIPPLLAALVMRLLEKQPDQRYQSAAGLAHDLGRIIAALREGELELGFPLGERDFPTALRMPRRLYGRAPVLAQLEQELATVRERGESRAVFLLGDAGLGKSALLRSFAAPLGSSVILAAGRFDADERGRPYRGFVDALGVMIEQLAGGSDTRRSELRQHLRERLGALLDVALDLVPALRELFAGQGVAAGETSLGPREVERRVHVGLRRLFAALAERSPIVMLLDDVQRLDPGSRELLRVLGSGIDGPILMIAAIQTRGDDEGEDSLADLRRTLVAGHAASELRLEPLGVGELASMLSSMLARSPRELGPLVERVRERTAGNPLLIRHVLHDWVEQGLLVLGERGWGWRSELDASAAASSSAPPATLAVGELLALRMARLGAEARLVLRHAACVGMLVELALLRQIVGLDDLRLADALAKLEDEGMLVAEGAEHRFAHERLLELAEAALAPEERARIHWRIAAVLRERGGEPGFALLDHVVAGLPAAGRLDEGERLHLVELAREGARLAASSAAWANAERYVATALVLASGLPPDPARTFALRTAHAEALALIGRHDEGDREFAALLEHPLEPGELGRLVARRLEILAKPRSPRRGPRARARDAAPPRPRAPAFAGLAAARRAAGLARHPQARARAAARAARRRRRARRRAAADRRRDADLGVLDPARALGRAQRGAGLARRAPRLSPGRSAHARAVRHPARRARPPARGRAAGRVGARAGPACAERAAAARRDVGAPVRVAALAPDRRFAARPRGSLRARARGRRPRHGRLRRRARAARLDRVGRAAARARGASQAAARRADRLGDPRPAGADRQQPSRDRGARRGRHAGAVRSLPRRRRRDRRGHPLRRDHDAVARRLVARAARGHARAARAARRQLLRGHDRHLALRSLRAAACGRGRQRGRARRGAGARALALASRLSQAAAQVGGARAGQLRGAAPRRHGRAAPSAWSA